MHVKNWMAIMGTTVQRIISGIVLLLTLGLILSACSVDIARNPDGSLKVESRMSEAALQSELSDAIADPLIKNFTIELHHGFALARMERKRVLSNETDMIAFRLDLGALDGQMTANISAVDINGFPLNPEWVEVWNERIALKLERAGRRNPNSSLELVQVDPAGITMTWQVETAQSLER